MNFVTDGWRFWQKGPFPGAEGSEWWSWGGGRSLHFCVATPGQVPAQMRSVLFAPLEAEDPVSDLGVPMSCSVSHVRTEGRTLFHCRRTRTERRARPGNSGEALQSFVPLRVG